MKSSEIENETSDSTGLKGDGGIALIALLDVTPKQLTDAINRLLNGSVIQSVSEIADDAAVFTLGGLVQFHAHSMEGTGPDVIGETTLTRYSVESQQSISSGTGALVCCATADVTNFSLGSTNFGLFFTRSKEITMPDSIVDQVFASVAEQDHRLALKAMQDEIHYEQQRDKNRTYLSKVVNWIHDGSKGTSRDLEIAYNNELLNPNSMTKEEVIDLVKADQKAIRHQDFATNLISTVGGIAATTFGGTVGKVIATGLFASNGVNAEASWQKQALQATIMAASGYGATVQFQKSMRLSNPIAGVAMGTVSAFGPTGTSYFISDFVTKPDVEKTFSTPITEAIPSNDYTPNMEWPDTSWLLERKV